MCNEESCERRAAYLHAYEDDFDNVRSDDAKPLLDSVKALQVRLDDVEAQRDSWRRVAERNEMKLDPPPQGGPMRIYRDTNDWWIGYYRGDTHHYVCPLPTLVIRWGRR